jgi:hypothetical protein
MTALFGLPDVDRKFDVEFALGTEHLGVAGRRPEWVPALRSPFRNSLREPGVTPSYVPDKPWRARSGGFAVAPFLVIDEIATQTGPLAGISGHRVAFWFFGFSIWTMLNAYWVS